MSELRDLGYVAWKDPQAWMESMQGDRWKAFVKDENAHFQAALAPLADKREVKAILGEFESAEEKADANSVWILRRGGTKLKVVPHPGGVYECMWIKGGNQAGKSILVEDLDICSDGVVVFSIKIDEKKDIYRISAVKGPDTSPLWSFTNRGGSIAALEDRLYVLEGDSPIQYTRLVSYDIKTGRGK